TTIGPAQAMPDPIRHKTMAMPTTGSLWSMRVPPPLVLQVARCGATVDGLGVERPGPLAAEGAGRGRVRPSGPGGDAGGAGPARPAQPVVSAGILRQVLLVIVLRVVEGGGRADLGRDRAVAGPGEGLLVGVPRRLGSLLMAVAVGVDRRAVLGPDVVALAHALGRIVRLPEDPEQLLVAHGTGIEDDQHHLGVSGPAAAHLLVRRVRREAARVAGGRRVDALRLPELPLRAPEAAEAEDGLLEALGERRLQRVAADEMAVGHRDRLGPAGRRVGL